jgi:hypothetical protein
MVFATDEPVDIINFDCRRIKTFFLRLTFDSRARPCAN